MHIMKQLVQLLTFAINSKQVTITELAAIAGCSRQHIYNVLAGKQVPSVDIAERLAEAVGASIELVVAKKSKKVSA